MAERIVHSVQGHFLVMLPAILAWLRQHLSDKLPGHVVVPPLAPVRALRPLAHEKVPPVTVGTSPTHSGVYSVSSGSALWLLAVSRCASLPVTFSANVAWFSVARFHRLGVFVIPANSEGRIFGAWRKPEYSKPNAFQHPSAFEAAPAPWPVQLP